MPETVQSLTAKPEFVAAVQSGVKQKQLCAEYAAECSQGTIQRAYKAVQAKLDRQDDASAASEDAVAGFLGPNTVEETVQGVTITALIADESGPLPDPQDGEHQAKFEIDRVQTYQETPAPGYVPFAGTVARIAFERNAAALTIVDHGSREPSFDHQGDERASTIILSHEIDPLLRDRIGDSLSRLEVDPYADDLIRSLPLLPNSPEGDDCLIEVARTAYRAGESAWRVLACCAYTIQRRVEGRLAGGRGQKDTDGTGVTAQLARFAATIGIESVRTVQKDAKVFEVFYLDNPDIAATPVGKTYHTIAITAPDPREALAYAVQQVETDPTFNTQKFRSYVSTLREGKTAKEAEEDFCYFTVRLNAKAGEGLKRLKQRMNNPVTAEVLEFAIAAALEKLGAR